MKHAILLTFLALPALADSPVVERVEAVSRDSGWTFTVTVRHADEGWDHYADAWAVFAPDGTELGRRVLLHPHETEQPFTRSQFGIEVPEGLRGVVVRAHDTVHGWGADHSVALP